MKFDIQRKDITLSFEIGDIHMNTSNCRHLVPSKRARLEYHGHEMATLDGTRLKMCTKPQQTAEMNASY